MATSPVTASSGNAGAAKLSSRFSDMSSEDFIKIMFTELENQDPFQPNDSAALLQQLNSIRSIESDAKMTDQLRSIVTQNQLASAGTLIGRQIQGLTNDANRVAGQVVSVAKQDDSVSLLLDTGWVVPMDNVEVIVDPSTFGTP
ncbi:MAG: flagellar hook capping FlgD N-terminal domain-containing protein [Phycisphaerales bacterium]